MSRVTKAPPRPASDVITQRKESDALKHSITKSPARWSKPQTLTLGEGTDTLAFWKDSGQGHLRLCPEWHKATICHEGPKFLGPGWVTASKQSWGCTELTRAPTAVSAGLSRVVGGAARAPAGQQPMQGWPVPEAFSVLLNEHLIPAKICWPPSVPARTREGSSEPSQPSHTTWLTLERGLVSAQGSVRLPPPGTRMVGARRDERKHQVPSVHIVTSPPNRERATEVSHFTYNSPDTETLVHGHLGKT